RFVTDCHDQSATNPLRVRRRPRWSTLFVWGGMRRQAAGNSMGMNRSVRDKEERQLVFRRLLTLAVDILRVPVRVEPPGSQLLRNSEAGTYSPNEYDNGPVIRLKLEGPRPSDKPWIDPGQA